MIGSPTVGNVFGEVMAFIPLFPSLTGLVEGCSQSHYLHIILGYALEDQENSYYVRESSQAEKKKKKLALRIQSCKHEGNCITAANQIRKRLKAFL